MEIDIVAALPQPTERTIKTIIMANDFVAEHIIIGLENEVTPNTKVIWRYGKML